jgi:nucleotide-binding universal stress UspA family protein
VPIDFSETSIRALETAQGLARRFGATIHLAHVHESYYPGIFLESQTPFAGLPLTYLENTRDSAERQLMDLAAKHKITGTCEVELGGPAFEGICRIARKVGADLIVTSTHGRTGVQRVFLGSTAERLVQHSPCPVLVTRERKEEQHGRRMSSKRGPNRINTIVVPVDFSHASLDGLKYAIQFASKVKARILVLTVIHLGYAYIADGYAMYDLSVLEKAARAAAEREIKIFLRRVKFGSVKFETAIETGAPMHQICTFAGERKVDLIITSTHGYSGFKHVLIGSTAEQVVRRATCPVLVVPSHSERRVGQIAGHTEVRIPTRVTGPAILRSGLVRSTQPRNPVRFRNKLKGRRQLKKDRERAVS